MIKGRTAKSRSYWERNEKSGGYLFKRDVINFLVKIGRFVLLFGLSFLILQPILNKISVSFMDEQDLYNPTIVSIPVHVSGRNYQIATSIMEYTKGIINSAIISLSIALIQTTMCLLVGYGFARFKFPLKNLWFAFVFMLIIIPPQAFSSSLYLHFSHWDFLGIAKAVTGNVINLRSKPLPYYMMSLTCMGLKNGLYIYLIRQFFRNIPVDLEEAAYVAGCGMMKTFRKIMLPEAKPIITSCFMFALVWQWTDGFYSKTFMAKTTLISTKLVSLVDSLGVYVAREQGAVNDQVSVSTQFSNAILGTGTLLIVLPILVVYLFAQRAFVESISSTGIKM